MDNFNQKIKKYKIPHIDYKNIRWKNNIDSGATGDVYNGILQDETSIIIKIYRLDDYYNENHFYEDALGELYNYSLVKGFFHCCELYGYSYSVEDDSKEIYLVQPNEKYETPNLVKVLEDPNIQIVIHFARKDKNAIENFLKPKCKIFPLFDSKIASRLVRKYSNDHGLSSLCQEFAGVRLEKRMASSDWAKDISAYSQKEKMYAAADVQYLYLIKTKLEAMLKREKKYDIFLKCMKFIDTRIALDNLGID